MLIENAFDHDPDANPNWTPKFALRVYQCSGCSNKVNRETGNTGPVYITCRGDCVDYIENSYSGTTTVPVQTKHDYVELA
jgi:hypothetical protein